MKKTVIVFILMMLFTTIASADQLFVCCVHKGEWVWVRDAPSENGNKIDTIRYGVECNVSKIVDMYAYCKYRDTCEGWVHVNYLEKPIKEEVWVVNTSTPINKRETPDGRYMTKIKAGTRISVLGWRYSKKGELWAKVFKGGYVKAEYLSKP